MLAVTVEFLHGLVRATSADDAALAGGDVGREWPPSPARLHSAFVAADGTGDRCQVTPGPVGIELLESPPVIRADAAEDVESSELNPRFVVLDSAERATAQEYPARKNAVNRPGVRLSLRHAFVGYVWDDVEPSGEQLEALRKRAARIPYLGCSDSPVRVRVSTSMEGLEELPAWVPEAEGTELVSVAYPGLIDRLDEAFVDWSAGSPRRRSWLAPHLMRYRRPGGDESHQPGPVALWVRFASALDGRKAVAVAETLRAAVLERFDALMDGAVPEVLHGHHPARSRGVEHVRWLPLPHAGHPHADGRIRGACVSMPPDTEGEVVEGVRQALASITELVRPGVFSTTMELFDGTKRPWSTNPLRWIGPSKQWVSVLPVVHERYVRGGPSLEEVARWCVHAGLPEPVAFEISRAPLVPGAASLPARYARRTGDSRSDPYGHLRLWFPVSVQGPVAIGRLRHFGLGLMAPERPSDTADA
jgi:CRISPR-associated protein Csb2